MAARFRLVNYRKLPRNIDMWGLMAFFPRFQDVAMIVIAYRYGGLLGNPASPK